MRVARNIGQSSTESFGKSFYPRSCWSEQHCLKGVLCLGICFDTSYTNFMNFAFYDLETTGISPAFDQPLQFAVILTDGEFREIERVNLRCRIAPHIIPSPWALAVTGVRPAQLTDPSLPSPPYMDSARAEPWEGGTSGPSQIRRELWTATYRDMSTHRRP